MKNIYDIHPEAFSENSQAWFTGFLRTLLIRTNFMINVRNRLGWRGLKPTFRNGEGWTCRIHGAKGVYGIAFEKPFNKGTWHLGLFKVYYFPAHNEEIVEDYSIAAAMSCQDPDYLTYVREFLCYPDFASMFEIAKIRMAVSEDGEALITSLIAQKQIVSISVEGVSCERAGQTYSLIEAGGKDQKLQAYKIAQPFFKVLAATISYNFSESPMSLKKSQISANVQNGSDDLQACMEFSLAYNTHEDFSDSDAETLCFWKKGMQTPRPDEGALFWESNLIQSSRFQKSYVDVLEKPQFILLTGFLGSGKTSFLKHLIEYHTANNRFVAVIQNEIGETGLDSRLLEDDYAVVEIDEGCVCCSLIGQLKKGILQILSNHQPDVIVLETSGLANPLNLMAELDEIDHLIRFDSVTTVVDMKNYREATKCSSVVFDQIKAADIILLSKTDLLDAELLISRKKELRLLNPAAMMINCLNGEVNPALLYAETNDLAVQSFKCNNKFKHAKHAHSHTEDGLAAIKITFDKALDKHKFIEKLNGVPQSIYRIKGVVKFVGINDSCFVQMVNGQSSLSPASGKEFSESFIICIGDSDSLNILNQYYFIN